MSIERHHAEWLSLLEIDGPFLAMPVLRRVFPQGLPADDPALARELRLAYEEWLDNQGGLRPEAAIHRAWVLWVLRRLLDLPDDCLAGAAGADDPRLDALGLWVAEQHETLRPDFVLLAPPEQAGGAARLLLMLLPPGQNLERPLAGRHWKASPATRMMTLLHAHGLRLGLVTNGERWMLVDAPRGGTTGFVSWYARLWLDERLTLRAFRGLLEAYRFFGVPEAETLEGLLAASAGQQQELTDQLGYQVRQAVEILVDAIDRADQDRGGALLRDLPLPELYQAAVTVMMRLVFLFAAEERDLLLLGDPLYDEHYAVSTLAARLREAADLGGEEVLGRRYDAWCRLLATFRAVHGGVDHERLRLPAYGGNLFDPDRFPFLEGRPAGSAWRDAEAHPLPIDNRTVLHLLEALQLLRVPVPGGGGAEMQRLSFRALGIEQIGHVYEGLLDHTAVRAQDVVLGLAGTKAKEPEIAVTRLEEAGGKGEEELLRLLKEETGRSEKALSKALQGYAINGPTQSRLLEACGNDPELLYRITPYAGLIREDSYGTPYVVRPRSAYVTAGSDRRATGAHYTPRSLTEPIVQRTLEPVVYRGPAEGLPREEWRLKSAGELLELKVCDMAMGSGAFLVQACRYLGERLMEAWEGAERGGGEGGGGDTVADAATGEGSANRSIIDITPAGAPAGEGDPVVPRDPVDRQMTALRLVASRCLYGVDKNPLAVEMAKLSLWLLTLAKGQRFTFLDHALKCGDSLVGLSRAQIERFSWDPPEQAGQMLLASNFIAERLQRAEELRRWVREAGAEVREEQLKQQNRAAEQALEDVRLIGDVLIAAFFAGDKPKAREGKRLAAWEQVRGWLGGDANAAEGHAELLERAAALRAGAKAVAPFHWEVEFPEVFGRVGAGFDGVVGNPPFLGGTRISEVNGMSHFQWLVAAYLPCEHHCDLVAYFFRRGFALLRAKGCLGLIATNTISQGDTREGGLAAILKSGGHVFAATTRFNWPGQAAVIVSVIHISKDCRIHPILLDELEAERISAYLVQGTQDASPNRLAETPYFSLGSKIYGQGFLFADGDPQCTPIAERTRILELHPEWRPRIRPYLVGEDLNSSPHQAPGRYVIVLNDVKSEQDLSDWPELRDIVESKVRPERLRLGDNPNNIPLKKRWWAYQAHRPELYAAIAKRQKTLCVSRVSQCLAFAFAPTDIIFSEAVVVFDIGTFGGFTTLQSRPHEIWARFFGSSMKDDLRYTPSDCFETFPFPPAWETDPNLEAAGEAYYTYRAQLMVANDEGLTKTYNRFHDPEERSAEIARLRELHAAMDRAVLDAYGWSDVPTDCQFLLDYEVTEESAGKKKPWRYRWPDAVRDDVLGRLLALNQARYEEEVARGLHGGAGGKAGKRVGAGRKGKGGDDGAQGRLL